MTFFDGRSISDGERIDVDVAVVGAGAAGISIALELNAAGMRVGLIESGDRTPDTATQLLYQGDNVGLPYFDLVSARLRYLGGSTNHWSGTCRPVDAFDLERHDWIPGSGWPIGLSDLESHYARAAELCGLPSQDWGTETWADRSPYPILQLDGEVVESRVAQNVRATRRRFGPNFEEDLEAGPGPVLLNSNVIEIELDPDDPGQVSGLLVRTLEGTGFSVTARAYVLACGGIENPRLLLASNRTLPAGVGNGMDVVGRYFLEHPRFVAGLFAPFESDIDARFYETHDAGSSRITGYLAIPEARRRREGIVDVQFRLEPRLPDFYRRATESDDVAALRRLVGRSEDPADLLADAGQVADDLTSWRRFLAFGGPLPVPAPELAADAIDPNSRQELIPDVFGDIATLAYGETFGPIPVDGIDVVARIDPVPNPDSRVQLGTERDSLGVPRVQLDWQLMDQDRLSVDRALDILGSELARARVGRLRAVAPEAPGWPSDMTGGWHHMGTTRMADDPSRGVVDRDCRVHGMRNLYVAGSSVFSTATSATPTLTLVALAIRLAQHLQTVGR